MQRRELDTLKAWKESKDRKPMIIRGARQVGKTWLMQEFGKSEYRQVAYVNFEISKHLQGIFTDDYDVNRILTALQIETGLQINSSDTLVIFDEIQAAPAALGSLKYFRENAPHLHILAAGSLLGVALHSKESFPVGKVDFLDLYPLNYVEFLDAIGQQELGRLLMNRDWKLITAFKNRYISYLRQYFYLGGMPEVVLNFTEQHDFPQARNTQKRILQAFEQDFSKHAPNEIVPRIRMLWNAIPAQLAKENRKFIYGAMKEGARARDYELALSWLIDCGLVYKVNRASKPAIPLIAYQDQGAFKLFVVDVGLLSAMGDLDEKTLIGGNEIFREFKGAFTEQYVLQQLMSERSYGIYYWAPSHAKAEIDFIVQHSGMVIPVEVKAEENLQAKSLKTYCGKYQPPLAVRTSMSDYREEPWFVNLPLYAISALKNLRVS